MSLQHLLTTLLLPPLLLIGLALLACLWAARGNRGAARFAALCLLALLALATPQVAGLLHASLEAGIDAPPGQPGAEPAMPRAIIVLAADALTTTTGASVGGLTLERLRAGATLHRATGLPVLVTGGVLGRGQPPVARLMAGSLAEDFQVATRWVEERAGDTRENADFSAALLRAEGIGTAYLVTHAWHTRRARAAFARAGLVAIAAPVPRRAPPRGGWVDLVPRANVLGESWFMLRELLGLLVYRLRDGG